MLVDDGRACMTRFACHCRLLLNIECGDGAQRPACCNHPIPGVGHFRQTLWQISVCDVTVKFQIISEHVHIHSRVAVICRIYLVLVKLPFTKTATVVNTQCRLISTPDANDDGQARSRQSGICFIGTFIASLHNARRYRPRNRELLLLHHQRQAACRMHRSCSPSWPLREQDAGTWMDQHANIILWGLWGCASCLLHCRMFEVTSWCMPPSLHCRRGACTTRSQSAGQHISR